MILLSILIKKNHPQVYLEECKYRIKKTQIPKFIKNELKSDSELDLDSDLDDKESMAKLKDSDSDSDSEVESKPNAKKTSLWKNLNKNVIIIDDLFVNTMIIDVYWWLLVIIDNYYWWLFFYYWWLFDYVMLV